MKINLYPARRGLRPAWADMSEADDLMALHRKKPLAPGETFHNNVDLLTRYQVHLKSLLSK
jgi:hypothetical protein